jgi:TRAP-type C4-dicarboxylate transport system permease small subunit
MMERAFDALMRAIEAVLALALLAAIVLNFVNVVGRYGFGHSIVGADEVQIYSMLWIAFLGAGVVAWRGEHLRMDALARLFPPRLSQPLRVLELALLVVLCGFVMMQSWRYTAQMATVTSAFAGIPMWIPHSAVVAGFAAIAFVCVRHLVKGGRP